MGKMTVHVVLDRSGSMQAVKADTIGAFNEYVKSLADESANTTLSLTLFDSGGIDTIVDNAEIGLVAPLNGETFQPRGLTPLFDAIGTVVGKLTEAKGKRKALVILTDGQENASREWTQERIKSLLTEKQEKENWLVIYLGANQDAFEVGRGLGMNVGTTMSYDTANMAQTFRASARATNAYGQSSNAAEGLFQASFTDKERDDAGKA